MEDRRPSFMESSSLPTTENSSSALSARCITHHIGDTDAADDPTQTQNVSATDSLTELGGLDDSLGCRLSVSARLDKLQERLDKFEERTGAHGGSGGSGNGI